MWKRIAALALVLSLGGPALGQWFPMPKRLEIVPSYIPHNSDDEVDLFLDVFPSAAEALQWHVWLANHYPFAREAAILYPSEASAQIYVEHARFTTACWTALATSHDGHTRTFNWRAPSGVIDTACVCGRSEAINTLREMLGDRLFTLGIMPNPMFWECDQ